MNQMSKGHEQIGLFSKATIYGWIFFTLAGCFFYMNFSLDLPWARWKIFLDMTWARIALQLLLFRRRIF